MRANAGMQDRWAALARPLRLLVLGAATLVLVLAATIASGPNAATAQTSTASNQRVDAMAGAGLAYVQVDWRGYVILPADIPTSSTTYMPQGTYGPYDASMTCSGFVASPNGEIVTAGHCVDAQSFNGGKGAIIQAMLASWRTAAGQPLSEAEISQRADLLRANAQVEGSDSGSPVDRSVQISVPSVAVKSQPANVVDVRPFTQGDVALVHASGVKAPLLPVAQSRPENGESVVAAGYSGKVASVVDAATSPSFKEGRVSGTQTVNGVPFTEISADVSQGMSGGPVLNMQGEVIGTVSWSPSGSSSSNFITDVSSIQSLLKGNGVNNTLTGADQAYRQGVTYYFEHQYHNAVTQFDKALAAQPNLVLAQEFRSKAIANYPNDVAPPSSGLPWWAYAVIGAAVLVVAGGATTIMVRRRRRPPPSQPGATTTPTGEIGAPPEGAPSEPVPKVPSPAETGAPSTPQPSEPSATPSQPPVPLIPVEEHQPQLLCPNCGARYHKGAHFCERCGQPLPLRVGGEHGADGKLRG